MATKATARINPNLIIGGVPGLLDETEQGGIERRMTAGDITLGQINEGPDSGRDLSNTVTYVVNTSGETPDASIARAERNQKPIGLDMNAFIQFAGIAKPLVSADQVVNVVASVGKVANTIKDSLGAIGFDLFKYGSEKPTGPQSEAEAKKVESQNDAARVNQHNTEVSQSIMAESREHQAKQMVSDQQGSLNDLLGLSNGAYEIGIGPDGKARSAYHKTAAEQKELDRIADDKRAADKANARALFTGKGKSMGGAQATDDINQATESFDQNKTRFTG